MLHFPGDPVAFRSQGCHPHASVLLAGFASDEAALRQRLTAGASANDPAEFIQGCAPLYAAAQKGHLNVVRVLVEAAASLEATSPDGATALIKAVQKGHAPCVEALLAGGAHPEAAQNQGFTALSLAAEKATPENA